MFNRGDRREKPVYCDHHLYQPICTNFITQTASLCQRLSDLKQCQFGTAKEQLKSTIFLLFSQLISKISNFQSLRGSKAFPLNLLSQPALIWLFESSLVLLERLRRVHLTSVISAEFINFSWADSFIFHFNSSLICSHFINFLLHLLFRGIFSLQRAPSFHERKFTSRRYLLDGLESLLKFPLWTCAKCHPN